MRILESWIVVLNQWHHGSLTRGRSIRELYYAHWRAQLNAMLRAAAKEDGTQTRIDLIPAQKSRFAQTAALVEFVPVRHQRPLPMAHTRTTASRPIG
jgi:hypothetical protein